MQSSVEGVQAPALNARIDNAISRLVPDAEVLLEQLVAINSVNPGFPGIARDTVIGGETACTRLIGSYLSKLGFELNEIAVDPERVNLAAVLKGTGGGRLMCPAFSEMRSARSPTCVTDAENHK